MKKFLFFFVISLYSIQGFAGACQNGANASGCSISTDDTSYNLTGNISTTGANSHAVYTTGGSSNTINVTGNISTTGGGARAVYTTGGGSNTINVTGDISTTGPGGIGINFDITNANTTNATPPTLPRPSGCRVGAENRARVSPVKGGQGQPTHHLYSCTDRPHHHHRR